LQLDGLAHAVQPGDDRPLVQAEPRPCPNCSPNAAISLSKPNSVARGPHRRDLVGADAGFTAAIAASIHSRAFV
jgi:hypothetical protein